MYIIAWKLPIIYVKNNTAFGLTDHVRLNYYYSLKYYQKELKMGLIRAGVNSAPELELIANSKSGIGIELELPSLELELNWNCHHWNMN